MRKLLSWSPAVALVAVVAIVVMGSSSNAMADDAWLERISNLISRVEAAVHKLDDQQTIAGAEVPARLEGLDRRISKLEHDNGLAQGNLHLYRGDNETRQLESWTQAAASLGQRAGKVKVTLDAALVDKLRKTRDDTDATSTNTRRTSLRSGSSTAIPPRAPDGGTMGEGAEWVQAYDPTRNRTIWAVTRIPSAKDLWQEVSIEFQHEEGTVNYPAEDPATWPLSRLLRETTLINRFNTMFVDHDKARTFEDEGTVTIRVGAADEGIELKGIYRKDKTLALVASENRVELMSTEWPAAPYRQMLALAKEMGPLALPYGTLQFTTYSIPAEARQMVMRLAQAFDERDAMGANLTVEDAAAKKADDGSGTCRNPGGAVDCGQR